MSYELYGMARLGTGKTKLPLALYISDSTQNKKQPRLKAGDPSSTLKDKNTLSITIDKDPKIIAGNPANFKKSDIKAVISWIKKNRSLLLKYWYNIEQESTDVALHLFEGKDMGSESFDAIIVKMVDMWQRGVKKDDIAKSLKLPPQSVDLIVSENRELFPKRKK